MIPFKVMNQEDNKEKIVYPQENPPVENLHTSPISEETSMGGQENMEIQSEQKSSTDKPLLYPKKKKLLKVTYAVVSVIVGVLLLFITVKFIISKLYGGGNVATIAWWGIIFDEEAVKPLIEDFQRDNPGVKISYIKQSPFDYRNRLIDSINKESCPDIFEIHNSWGPMFKGGLDKVPSLVMTEAEYSTIYYPIVAKDMSIDGGFGGIPLYFDALTLFVNNEIFEREGRVFPTTWEDLKRIAAGLTKRNADDVLTQSGVALGITENINYWEEILSLLFLQNEASLSIPEGDLAKGAINFFMSFGGVEGDWDMTMADSTKAFAAGKLAMLFAPLKVVEEIKVINPSLNFRTIKLPQIAKATPDQPNISYANYWVESVNSSSKEKGAAWKFLKFLSEKENLVKLHENQVGIVGIYPRTDMSDSQINDPILGSVVNLSADAKSWYLYSETFDGDLGINTLTREVYKKAIFDLNSSVAEKKVYEELLLSISQILSKYSIQ